MPAFLKWPSRRSRNSTPRDLPISISATTLPSSDGGGVRRARRGGGVSPGGARGLLGLSPSLNPKAPGLALIAAAGARPAAEHGREYPGRAAGANDQEAAGSKFVDHLVCELGRQTLGHALRALHQVAPRALQRLEQLVLDAPAVPAAILEDLVVLGRQHQYGVAGVAELG